MSLSDLEIEKENNSYVLLTQKEFDDAWTFHVKWDGCLNFGQYDSREDGEFDGWEHACNLDQLISHLEQVRDYARAKWGKEWPK